MQDDSNSGNAHRITKDLAKEMKMTVTREIYSVQKK